MARHTEITLDGETYKVPTLTIDQLERLAEVQGGLDPKAPAVSNAKVAFDMFKVIVEEMEPKVEGKIRASMDEVTAAINAVMGGAGVINASGNPPRAVEKPAA